MPDAIPQDYMDLFQKKAFANLATLMPDGTPQVTPVWVDFDGTHVLVTEHQYISRPALGPRTGNIWRRSVSHSTYG